MAAEKLKIVYLSPKKLIPYFRNTKAHPTEQIDKIASSISEFKFDQPIVVDEGNIIIKGHGRREAALRLKMETVPVIVRTDLSDAQKKAARIMDNKSAESDWIESDLILEFKDLKELDFDLDLTGFDIGDIKDIEVIFENNLPGYEGHSDPDEVPENVVTVCKEGQLWKLGNHRLLCGDCTDVKQVERLMGGVKADMVFTDPPYSIQTEGGCKGNIGKGLRKQGQDILFISDFSPDGFLKILPSLFFGKKMNSYIFSNKKLLPNYLNWAVDKGYSFNVLVWKKPNAIPIGDSHRPDIEYLILFRKYAIWNNGLNGVNYSRCLEYGRESGLHPTMKPVDLLVNEMKISSNRESVIVDLFLGSGSTLIACEKTKRKCKGMEIDPHYCDVILQRWSDFTKLDPVREDGKLFSELKK